VEKPERKPISKTLRALSWLAESSNPEVGVRQLAAAMNIAPSSTHRILLALSEAGFVRRDGRTQRYALGNEFLRLSHLAIAKAPLRQAGAEAMRRLVESCDESALLGIYDDGRQEMICAASVESKHSSQRAIQLNKWIPVRTGASGLAILAFLREAEARSIVQRLNLPAPGGAGRADPGGLEPSWRRFAAGATPSRADGSPARSASPPRSSTARARSSVTSAPPSRSSASATAARIDWSTRCDAA
jgi:DNA-binding IclR family transcriptional regulator